MIRIAVPEDAAAIHAIYTPHVLQGMATFETELPGEAAMRDRAKEWVGRMDFVSREEFEAVKQMAATARAEAEALKARLDKLEGAAKTAVKPATAAKPTTAKPAAKPKAK